MTVADEFWAAVAWARDRPELSRPDGEGSRLAWAAGQVLGGAGAGIGLSADRALRIPWGSSDLDAAQAERLQFTAGQGPCLDAFVGRQPVMASRLVITRFWPGFAEPFLLRTPYRSVFAIPIGEIGVLDVYFGDDLGCLTVDVGAATEVAHEIWTAAAASEPLTAIDPLTGVLAAADGVRSQVSVAVGVLVAALDLSAPDALAVLRAHAFSGGRSVDEVAVDVVAGTLDPRLLG